jgi:hypothetical protein
MKRVELGITQRELEWRLDVTGMTIWHWRRKPEDPFPCLSRPTPGGRHKNRFRVDLTKDWLARNRPRLHERFAKSFGASK